MVVGGEIEFENLKIVAFLRSGLKPAKSDPIFVGRLKSSAIQVYGEGESSRDPALCLGMPP